MLYKDNFAVQVKDLNKDFAIYNVPSNRLKQMVIPKIQNLFRLKQKKYYKEFSALNRISFNVSKGECVGILGRNGAGKSTLLQIICGTQTQSSGNVIKQGRIAALLELGSGFNPEYSGKENIFLNGSILGLTKEEIEHKYEDIVNFANIGEFIDYPVKLYSSGMYVRLAFAIAINIDPDILIIDEALAVGDEDFQRKCYSKIDQIKKKGTTILFVSHSTQTIVEICDKAILIDSGKLLIEGDPNKVVKLYQKILSATNVKDVIKDIEREIQNIHEENDKQITLEVKNTENNLSQRFSSKQDESWFDSSLNTSESVKYESTDAEISNTHIENFNGEEVNYLKKGFNYYICYNVKFNKKASNVGFGMLIKTYRGIEVGGASSFQIETDRLPIVNKGDQYKVKIKFNCSFRAGSFFYNVGILSIEKEVEKYVARILDAGIFRIIEEKELVATSLLDLNVSVEFKKI